MAETLGQEPTIMPRISIVPGINLIGRLARGLSFLPSETLASHGDHFPSWLEPQEPASNQGSLPFEEA